MTSNTVATDVQTVLNAHRFSPYQWLIFGLCFLIVLFDGFDTAAIGYIAPSLITEWGVSKPDLAPVLSAALFGLASGAVFAGPLADRFGRKGVLVASVLVYAVACLASGFATDIGQLTAMRFVTGLGLGAAMPNAVTLMSEYCPDARRSTLTNAMFCGFPLGAAFGGFLAAWMIPHFGWRSVLYLGGAAPLLLTVLLVLLLPESVRHMVRCGYPAERIRTVMTRIAGKAMNDIQSFTTSENKPASKGGGGFTVVLSNKYWIGTLSLWTAYFMGLVIFYSLINWMPVLFKDTGLDPKTGAMVTALFPLGGVAAVAVGWLMDRFEANLVVAAGFALTAVALWWIGQTADNLGLMMAAVFATGILMNASQSSLAALAASFYPTDGRATGVAWMMAVGRLGGIAGSFLVAELAVRKLGFSAIFATLAVPGLIAATALLVKRIASPKTAG